MASTSKYIYITTYQFEPAGFGQLHLHDEMNQAYAFHLCRYMEEERQQTDSTCK